MTNRSNNHTIILHESASTYDIGVDSISPQSPVNEHNYRQQQQQQQQQQQPPPPPPPSVPFSNNNNTSNNNCLTTEQNNQLVRLWKAHCRVIVDVRLSRDESYSNTSKKQRQSTPPPYSNDAYKFMVRLYQYFLSYLELNCSNLDSRDNVTLQHSNHNRNIIGSSLRSYGQLSLFSVPAVRGSASTVNIPNEASALRTKNATTSKAVRLIEGRHVLTLNHEEFMNELNQFEVQGSGNISEEFIRLHSFGSYLYFMPDHAIPALGCAMALAMVTLFEKQQQQPSHEHDTTITINNGTTAETTSATISSWKTMVERYVDNTQIVTRFAHVYPQIQMMDIKTGLVGKFVSIKGHVVKVRPKRLRVATADFLCQNCGSTMSHEFDSGQYSIPSKCISSTTTTTTTTVNSGTRTSEEGDNAINTTSAPTSSCRSKNFTFIRPTARYVNVQEIRLQEVQEENTMQAGRTPKQIEVELNCDLVNSCRPGDIVLVAAIVAAVNTAVAAGSKGKRTVQETSTYKLYLVGHSITTMSETNNHNNNNQSSRNSNRRRKSSSQSQQQQFIYTQQQLRNIVQLCHADHRYFSLVERRAFPFDLLVRSLCPSIIGHHEVKAGLMLCLLGGTPSQSNTATAAIDKGNSIRSNSHILIVGDPGMGKCLKIVL
jgi:MCM OB domain/MCM P-loop domain